MTKAQLTMYLDRKKVFPNAEEIELYWELWLKSPIECIKEMNDIIKRIRKL